MQAHTGLRLPQQSFRYQLPITTCFGHIEAPDILDIFYARYSAYVETRGWSASWDGVELIEWVLSRQDVAES
jgi:hypothetical protein